MPEAVQLGQPLPKLEVETAEGEGTTVQAHLGPEKTLLYFLHGTWCPQCVGQLHLLERYQPRFREAGAEQVVVTGEQAEMLQAFLRSVHPALE